VFTVSERPARHWPAMNCMFTGWPAKVAVESRVVVVMVVLLTCWVKPGWSGLGWVDLWF
jgi:hypothetical protein